MASQFNGLSCGLCGLLNQPGVYEEGDYCNLCWEMIDSGEIEHPEDPDYNPRGRIDE